METEAQQQIARLLDLMAALRDPTAGCPWDQAQTFDTIAPYTVEEAYEVADAIARRDMAALPDELGDLLFQVVYHARMAERPARSASPTSPAPSPTRWFAAIRTFFRPNPAPRVRQGGKSKKPSSVKLAPRLERWLA